MEKLNNQNFDDIIVNGEANFTSGLAHAPFTPNLFITVNQINVEGWPNNTLAIERWTATATMENGDPYLNKGVHFITLKWSKVTEIDVYEDTLVVYRGLPRKFNRLKLSLPVYSFASGWQEHKSGNVEIIVAALTGDF